jgi:hypothetical protein
MEAVFAINTAAWAAEFSIKIPGARLANGTVMGALVRSPLVTVNAACVLPEELPGNLEIDLLGGHRTFLG